MVTTWRDDLLWKYYSCLPPKTQRHLGTAGMRMQALGIRQAAHHRLISPWQGHLGSKAVDPASILATGLEDIRACGGILTT